MDGTRRRPKTRALVGGIATGALLLAACSSGPPAVTGTTATTEARPVPGSTTVPSAPTSPQLVRIAYLSPSQGHGLFEQLGTTSCSTQVGTTSDGGAAFTGLTTVVSWPCSQGDVLSNLAFDDHGDGFAYGSALYVTHDSGASWAPVHETGPVLAVAALGSSIWMAVAGCPATPEPVQCPVHLLKSNDGGRTWATSNVPGGAATAGATDEGGQTWLVRVSPDAAYLATRPLPSNSSPDTAPLWYTSDGGATWSERSVPCGIAAVSVVLSSTVDGTLFAVCGSQSGAGQQLKSVLRSTDGGRSWATMYACYDAVGPPPTCVNDPLSFGYLGEVDAPSNATVYLVGGRSPLLATHDAGARWVAVQPQIGEGGGGTDQVVFFSPSQGVVLGNGADGAPTIWATDDGGLQWHAVVPST